MSWTPFPAVEGELLTRRSRTADRDVGHADALAGCALLRGRNPWIVATPAPGRWP